MTSFLEQVWPWHFPSLLGDHLQEGDGQGTEVRGPDWQTQPGHLPLCPTLDPTAGRAAGLEGSHPPPLCSWVRDFLLLVSPRELYTNCSLVGWFGLGFFWGFFFAYLLVFFPL